jgi:hypothetical protein
MVHLLLHLSPKEKSEKTFAKILWRESFTTDQSASCPAGTMNICPSSLALSMKLVGAISENNRSRPFGQSWQDKYCCYLLKVGPRLLGIPLPRNMLP